MEEVFDWPQDYLQVLESHGYLEEFRATLRSGVICHTSFSGMGGPEQAGAMIHRAFGDDALPPIRFNRSCDNSPTCQRILKSFQEPHACAHVVADLLKLVSDDVLKKMVDILTGARAEFTGRLQAGQKPADFQRQVYEHIHSSMLELLFREVDWTDPEVPCVKTKANCKFWAEASNGELLGEIAGTICVHWSSMGSKKGWLGDS